VLREARSASGLAGGESTSWTSGLCPPYAISVAVRWIGNPEGQID
jgi:hypothetical protein